MTSRWETPRPCHRLLALRLCKWSPSPGQLLKTFYPLHPLRLHCLCKTSCPRLTSPPAIQEFVIIMLPPRNPPCIYLPLPIPSQIAILAKRLLRYRFRENSSRVWNVRKGGRRRRTQVITRRSKRGRSDRTAGALILLRDKTWEPELRT